MLRHTALFIWRDSTTAEQKLLTKKGLAYLSYGCPSVRAVDFGVDLLGGSQRLLDVKPWERTPMWRARTEGPPTNFDLSLNLDFDDEQGLDDYNHDDVHHEVGAWDAAVCRPERTARVDWWYDGPPRISRGGVRHTTLFLWDEQAADSAKADVRQAFRSLDGVGGVESLLVADNVGTLKTDYDLIVDVMLDDAESAKSFLEHPAHLEAVGLAAGATLFEWTARITHTMGLG
ncbi:MAG TPA: Dabb family protein [Acidimicrobiia bacterium]